MPWFSAYDHRHETVINHWSITYNEGVCATLAEDTRSFFGLTHYDEDTKNQKISHLPIGECLSSVSDNWWCWFRRYTEGPWKCCSLARKWSLNLLGTNWSQRIKTSTTASPKTSSSLYSAECSHCQFTTGKKRAWKLLKALDFSITLVRMKYQVQLQSHWQFVCTLYDPNSTANQFMPFLWPVLKTESQYWYNAANKWCPDSAHHEDPLSTRVSKALTNELWLAHGRRQVGPPALNLRTSSGQMLGTVCALVSTYRQV